MERILLIEDDVEVCDFIKESLESEGYELEISHGGEDGLRKLKENKFNLLILDLSLPDKDGLEICKQIRKDIFLRELPIIMLTARTEPENRVTGLETGADDYITKPFSVKELSARIKAVMRRVKFYEEEVITKGNITMDIKSRKVYVTVKLDVDLTPKEFELLYLLLKNSGKVLTRPYLLKTLWDYSEDTKTRTLDVHIQRLRKKLGEEAAKMIETVETYGYRFVE